MKLTQINAVDIQDSWFQCVHELVTGEHNKYIVQHGSFVGQTRLEFDYITIYIKHPYAEPYDLMLPKMPESSTLPPPVADGYVEQYIPYLMTGEKKEGELYTYGSRLVEYKMKDWYLDQIQHMINLLTLTPNTNQAVLQVAQPSDCLLDDPPCLRHICVKVKNNKLVFYPFFRSWDLWGGMAANLAGLAVLQKYMADEIGIDMGGMIASSSGLHLYGYVEDLAKMRCLKND
uniref:Putative thymidylate synthase n=1 Tax=viral metagenome TaxID=1070528 RepID=A0A6M3KYC9_9ZZZZ